MLLKTEEENFNSFYFQENVNDEDSTGIASTCDCACHCDCESPGDSCSSCY